MKKRLTRTVIFSVPLVFLLFAVFGLSAWGFLILPAVAVLLPTQMAFKDMLN